MSAKHKKRALRGAVWMIMLYVVGAFLALMVIGWSRFGIGPAVLRAARLPGELAVSFITNVLYGGSIVPSKPLPLKPLSFVAVPTPPSVASNVVSEIVNSAASTNPITELMTPKPQPAAGASTEEMPIKIVIDGASVSSSVSNPTTQDMKVLEQALLSGAVRYPTSAKLGTPGTMLIFGHSSYLPKIHNPAYRTFDGIQNLPKGSIIKVYSATAEYDYAVQHIRIVSAVDASQNVIPLPSDASHLVIVTCDTFASVNDRFVLDADFVSKESL